jgi:hypothetical protein
MAGGLFGFNDQLQLSKLLPGLKFLQHVGQISLSLNLITAPSEFGEGVVEGLVE